MTVGLLTATSDFLKSWADTHPLVSSQKQPRGPKQGTDPREMAFPFNRQLSKDRQHPTPTCVNCQLPQQTAQRWECPSYRRLFIAVVERSCSCGWRGMDFKGFFTFDVNPSPPHNEHVPSVAEPSASQGNGTSQGHTHTCR